VGKGYLNVTKIGCASVLRQVFAAGAGLVFSLA